MVPHGGRYRSLTADRGARRPRCRRPYSTRTTVGLLDVHDVARDTQALTRCESAIPERRPAGR